MLVQYLGVEADQFLGGEGVQVAADGIDRPRDVLGRAVRGALEHHVLDEMGDAVLLRGLAARPGADPDPDGHGAHVRHGFGDDPHAVFRLVISISRTGLEECMLWMARENLPLILAPGGHIREAPGKMVADAASLVGMELGGHPGGPGAGPARVPCPPGLRADVPARVTDLVQITTLPGRSAQRPCDRPYRRPARNSSDVTSPPTVPGATCCAWRTAAP